MTEEELCREIFAAAERQVTGPQPPFVEAVLERHPDAPFDYGARRAEQLAAAFGEPDKVYRPALGAPYVEISRHAVAPDAADGGAGCLYVTNGMSDFPQLTGDGTRRRTELVTATRAENPLAVDLLHTLAVEPFGRGIALVPPTAWRLDGQRLVGFEHVLLAQPRLPGRPSAIDLGGEPVELVSVAALSPEEFGRASEGDIDRLLEELGGTPDLWWLDARFGLEAAPYSEQTSAPPRIGELGCLEEATDSPCPQCGAELHEAEPSEATEPMLVCRRCGWTAMASAAAHTTAYLWAASRFRRVFGQERVEIDALPDGGAVILRLKLPDEKPVIVELRSADFDVNREADPEAVLERKLERVREYLGT